MKTFWSNVAVCKLTRFFYTIYRNIFWNILDIYSMGDVSFSKYVRMEKLEKEWCGKWPMVART